jgi:hypothetical protein
MLPVNLAHPLFVSGRREFAVAFVANAVIIGFSRSRGGAVW